MDSDSGYSPGVVWGRIKREILLFFDKLGKTVDNDWWLHELVMGTLGARLKAPLDLLEAGIGITWPAL
jgi:hypothetical protein